MSLFERVRYILQIGVVSAGGTMDAKLQTSSDSAFSSPHDVTGGAITQMTTSGKTKTLEIRSDQVQAQNPGDRYLRIVLTIGTNNILTSYVALGSCAPQKPAGVANNVAAVTQSLVVA